MIPTVRTTIVQAFQRYHRFIICLKGKDVIDPVRFFGFCRFLLVLYNGKIIKNGLPQKSDKIIANIFAKDVCEKHDDKILF